MWNVNLKEPEAPSYKGAVESVDMLSRAVRDRYRCPEDFLEFALSGIILRRGLLSIWAQSSAIGYGRLVAGHANVRLIPITASWSTSLQKLRRLYR